MTKTDIINSAAQHVKDVKKRSGQVAKFESNKILNAISKSLKATSKYDENLAEELTVEVIKRIPAGKADVEDIQDIVENVLLDKGLYETAKSYIVYRRERRKLRDEKMKLLNLNHLDEVSKRFDMNSLRVLVSRYLLKDYEGKLNENPDQMFDRVSITVGIPDILHDEQVFDIKGRYDNSIAKEDIKNMINDLDSQSLVGLNIGKYQFNKYHLETLLRLYLTLSIENKMKIPIFKILEMIKSGLFNKYESKIDMYKELMISRDFLPNSPTMMNAGARLGQLSACFVLDMKDDIDSIMKTAHDSAVIFKSGGGIGINYSSLRPEGDLVASTSGVASGPLSFIRIIDTVTDVIKQGGKRRGANMGIMDVWHPDVEKFIVAKTVPEVFENFNVSVGLWADYWEALKKGEKYNLKSPRTNKVLKSVDPEQIIDSIAMCAWKSAEPSVLFFDNINKHNVMMKAQGPLTATNPCGEQSLYPYESCNLGSINLSNFAQHQTDGTYTFDWQRYEQVIRQTTRFLDNVIDANKYPIPEIDSASRLSRRIGLGIMGLADLLYLLKIPYNSREGYELMNQLAEALTFYSMQESTEIAKERGAFPMYDKSDYVYGKLPIAGYYETDKSQRNYDWESLIDKLMRFGIRNSQTTTVAPTGTLSMIADCSNGVEPMFGLAFEKKVTVGDFYYANKIFENVLKQYNMYSEEIVENISKNYASIKGLEGIPEWMQQIYVTAMDIHLVDHVMAQAVWQKWITNAISKTINMPEDITAEEIKHVYFISHELGLKGVTIYRDGSRQKQVLHVTSSEKNKTFKVLPSDYVIEFIKTNIKDEFILSKISGLLKTDTNGKKKETVEVCPVCSNNLKSVEGCICCVECGWSKCSTG